MEVAHGLLESFFFFLLSEKNKKTHLLTLQHGGSGPRPRITKKNPSGQRHFFYLRAHAPTCSISAPRHPNGLPPTQRAHANPRHTSAPTQPPALTPRPRIHLLYLCAHDGRGGREGGCVGAEVEQVGAWARGRGGRTGGRVRAVQLLYRRAHAPRPCAAPTHPPA